MQKYPTLYNIDDNENIRVWYMEQNEEAYRTVSGVENGQLVFSGWKYAKGKNPGKKNETFPSEQAKKEILAKYKKQQEKGYSTNREEAGGIFHFQPMLAGKYTGEEVYPYYVQPKLDGMRCIATKDGLWSRNGKPIVSAPHIHVALSELFRVYPHAILDGELYNHALKADFDKIMSLAKKTKPTSADLNESAQLLEYHVYDLATLDGEFKDHFTARFTRLEALVRTFSPSKIALVDTCLVDTHETRDSLYAEWLADGYEGQMIRLPYAYEVGRRSKYLLKRKEFVDEEFEIVEVQEGTGNWQSYAKRVVCMLPDKSGTFEAGMRGNFEFAARLLNEKDEYVGGLATVRYQNLTPDGIPRFGVATAFYKKGEEKL